MFALNTANSLFANHACTSNNSQNELPNYPSIKLVQLNLTKAHAHQSPNYNLRKRVWQPTIGDWVYCKTYFLSNSSKQFTAKIAPKYSGPYQISQLLLPVIIKVRPRNRTIQIIHLQNCKAASAPNNNESAIDQNKLNKFNDGTPNHQTSKGL